MSQALYRKYRSKNMAEIVGQEHISDSISRAISQNKISHAYLLTGPRGTGKTSVARIIAHDINHFEYDEQCSHLDIIEIDAASNRRIDEIRDLREKIRIAPTTGKYKVYIIDEVHMLTREAFNALLKTLEEPPEHAVFILATTELHKVPDTIISRTQRFTFKPIEKSTIVKHLRNISKTEKISISDDALELIADHANGGFRDAISILDQIRSSTEEITINSVTDMLGMPPKTAIQDIWNALHDKSAETPTLLKQLIESGFKVSLIIKGLLDIAVSERHTALAKQLLRVSESRHPELELLLLSFPEETKIKSPSQQLQNNLPQKSDARNSAPHKEKTVAPEAEDPVKTAQSATTSKEDDKDSGSVDWDTILEKIKDSGSAVYGPLRLAQVTREKNTLKIGLQFPFHIKRISEAQNMALLTTAVTDVLGSEIVIDVHKTTQSTSKHEEKKVLLTEATSDDASLMSDPLSLVKNVFGNAEVL